MGAGQEFWILTASASGGFVGIKAVYKEQAFDLGLAVFNIYAVFDRPDDEMYLVGGTPALPLTINCDYDSSFYQDPEGAPLTAPYLQFLPGTSGMLAYDTFLTIGTKVDDLFTTLDDVSTAPGLTFSASSITTINGWWFAPLLGPGNGGLGAPNANGQVLLFQGSTVVDALIEGISGTMLLQFTSNGVPAQQAYVEFNVHVHIPSPDALPLLGLAGLCAKQRRRRAAGENQPG